MHLLYVFFLIFQLAISIICLKPKEYKPTWNSLDKRPIPDWYDKAKFGIFLHWGVFSVPSFGSEWFWWNWQGAKQQKYIDFMKCNYPPGFTYPEFAPKFTAEFYDPNQWADIFKASGAQYVVLTSKHHEGFTNWPSKFSWNWNAMDIGPNRDILGDLAFAIRNRTELRFGLYHSLFEWFHPLYLQDKQNQFLTDSYVKSVAMPELLEIVNEYKPEIIWSDGDWEAKDTYWKSREFIAWLYNKSPVKDTVLVNDRWGNNNISCRHGDFYTCSDRFNPGTLQKHKWENCMTIDKESWGFRREAKLSDYLTIQELLTILATTVSCNGNLLMNIGPTHDGRIIPIFEERLRQMGDWLKVNGEAIYETVPWCYQNDTKTPDIWYTSKINKSPNSTNIYAIALKWFDKELYLTDPQISSESEIRLLGYDSPLKFVSRDPGVRITIPSLSPNQLPCQWAWVFKITDVLN